MQFLLKQFFKKIKVCYAHVSSITSFLFLVINENYSYSTLFPILHNTIIIAINLENRLHSTAVYSIYRVFSGIQQMMLTAVTRIAFSIDSVDMSRMNICT